MMRRETVVHVETNKLRGTRREQTFEKTIFIFSITIEYFLSSGKFRTLSTGTLLFMCLNFIDTIVVLLQEEPISKALAFLFCKILSTV